jgi:hypothetical protein
VVVVVPPSSGTGRTRVLAIYADSPHAFGEAERRVLGEFGETVERALEATETGRQLESERRDADGGARIEVRGVEFDYAARAASRTAS